MIDLAAIRRIHFIGIGGVGMSALAHVLRERGYRVSGSDKQAGYIVRCLASRGVVVYIGHAACQVEGAEAVVVSTAISDANPELVEARSRNIPILHRSDVLAFLMNNTKRSVAVAGAHGKTTTSSMLSYVCLQNKLDPTVLVGGIIANIGCNAVNGRSDILVAEADESDGSFLKFHPYISIVTNIENDHLDHYGTEEAIQEAFAEFLSQIKPGGVAILCTDSAKVRTLAADVRSRVVTYGIDDADSDFHAKDISYGPQGVSFRLFCHGGEEGEVQLRIPGRHNVLNALATLAAAELLGIPRQAAVRSLEQFIGAKRRFETKGKEAGVWVVDDYAHHPTEIKATLRAARQTRPGRLVCVFQPHRYTRTQLLYEEFATAFTDCDKLILTDIYAASEEPIPGITGEFLAAEVAKTTGQDVEFIHGFAEIEQYLLDYHQPGDLIITMGAGNVYAIGESLVKKLREVD